MAELKPLVDLADVTQVLERELGSPVERLEPIAGGNVASTFGFTADNRDYIVRFNARMTVGFEKEAFIARAYASTAVPIPETIAIGDYQQLVYAISRRAPGKTVDALPPEQTIAVIPQLITTLDAIHTADTSATTGFGTIGNDGNGLNPSWHAYLTTVREAGEEAGIFADWQRLFETSFLDRAAFDRTYAVMERLLPTCPEMRSLLHGDFGFSNLLVSDGEIAAVIDWINAAYGDFLYDIAWLVFWGMGTPFAERVRRHYADTGRAVEHFDERLRCYSAVIGLNASRFFAVTGNEPAYHWVQARLVEIGVHD